MGPRTWQGPTESRAAAVGRPGVGGGLHQVAKRMGHSRIGRRGPPERELAGAPHQAPSTAADAPGHSVCLAPITGYRMLALGPGGHLQEAGPCPGPGASPEVLSGWRSKGSRLGPQCAESSQVGVQMPVRPSSLVLDPALSTEPPPCRPPTHRQPPGRLRSCSVLVPSCHPGPASYTHTICQARSGKSLPSRGREGGASGGAARVDWAAELSLGLCVLPTPHRDPAGSLAPGRAARGSGAPSSSPGPVVPRPGTTSSPCRVGLAWEQDHVLPQG